MSADPTWDDLQGTIEAARFQLAAFDHVRTTEAAFLRELARDLLDTADRLVAMVQGKGVGKGRGAVGNLQGKPGNGRGGGNGKSDEGRGRGKGTASGHSAFPAQGKHSEGNSKGNGSWQNNRSG